MKKEKTDSLTGTFIRRMFYACSLLDTHSSPAWGGRWGLGLIPLCRWEKGEEGCLRRRSGQDLTPVSRPQSGAVSQGHCCVSKHRASEEKGHSSTVPCGPLPVSLPPRGWGLVWDGGRESAELPPRGQEWSGPLGQPAKDCFVYRRKARKSRTGLILAWKTHT